MSDQLQIDLGKVLLTPRGDYSSNTQYDYLDFVLYGGSSYVAKDTVIGIAPTDTTKWQKMSDSIELSDAKISEIETALEDAKTEIDTLKASAVSDVQDSVQQQIPDIIEDATEQVRETLSEQIGLVVEQKNLAQSYAESARADKEAVQGYKSSVEQSAQYVGEQADRVEELVSGISEAEQYYNEIKDYNDAIEANVGLVQRYTQNAQTYATNASNSEARARASETNARLAETNSKQSEDNAKASEDNSQVYANNAYNYYTQIQGISETLLGTLNSDIALRNVSGATATVNNEQVNLLWSDPEDILYEDIFEAIWDGTKLVRKEGSIPTNHTDGVLIVDNKVRDMYASSAYIDRNVEYGITYYYRWFPYTKNGVYTNGTSIGVDVSLNKIYSTPTQDEVITYNGDTKTAHFADYDPTTLTATGITGRDAGVYTAVFTPKPGYGWANGSTEPRTVQWEIRKATVSGIPAQSNALTYSGRTQEPVWNNYNNTKVTISGDVNGINAGTYTAIFTPNNNYCWPDLSSAPVAVNWIINKHAGDITLSVSNVRLTNETPIASVTVTNPTGNISVTSTDLNVATPAITDNNTIVISNSNQASGNAVITVSVAESENYFGTSKEITVVAKYLKIVSWTDGTDGEICSMVDAALEGKINLADYWSVGQERQVNIDAITSFKVGESQAAQTITLVLVHQGLYQFASSTTTNSEGQTITPRDKNDNVRDTVSYVVAMKNNLATVGYMNTDRTNIGSWSQCARRAWCNDELYHAIPATLRPIFAQFKTITIDTYNGNELQTAYDYFALMASKEIDISTTYSNTVEANALTQFSYYASLSSHKIKKNGGNNSDQSSGGNPYFTRSPYKSSSYAFCIVNSSGEVNNRNNANEVLGISVFGCIK